MNQTKYLTDPEHDHLESLLARLAKFNHRDTLMIELLLKTGARQGELLNLTPLHIDQHNKAILIRGSKGSADREIPLSNRLFEQLMTHVGPDRQPMDKLFPITPRRLQYIWGEWRPSKKPLHCLRHTFAIRAYKKTKDIRLVQRALGHRSLANTLIYQQYVYGMEELRQLID